MPFKERSHLAGLHATLSASQNAWTNYTVEKLDEVYRGKLQANYGSELHDFAATCIRLNQKLADFPLTLNMYVNDCIGHRMTPEQVLYYSVDAFGTADAIDDRDDFLRIYDLKTGINEASFRQLETYAAFYCLDYNKDPRKLKGIELRIYQSDEIKVMEGDPLVILQIMDTIKVFAPRIAQIRAEVK
jgi:hypothetical protein